MATLEGRIISLPEAKSRRDAITQNLASLGQTNAYKFFTAIRGSDNHHNRQGLSKGEHGLWKSVLTILGNSAKIKSDYIHILEDDSTLSNDFFQWAKHLPKESSNTHIYFTDMWVGKQNFYDLKKLAEKAKKENTTISITDKSYSGCTSSWLIHKEHIPYVRKLVENEFSTMNTTRIPLDNFIRRLVHSGELNVKVSLPFLTSIELKEQYNSSIQTTLSKSILATRLFECLLRRRLSVLSESKDLDILSSILNDLMNADEIDNWLTDSLIPYLEAQKKYRYFVDTRLAEEPGNEQFTKGLD